MNGCGRIQGGSGGGSSGSGRGTDRCLCGSGIMV